MEIRVIGLTVDEQELVDLFAWILFLLPDVTS